MTKKRLRVDNRSPEYLKVSVHLKIEGKLKRSHQRFYYGRGSETAAFTLDDFARIIYMWDHIFCGGTTYAYDGLLQEMEGKLPKKDGETAKSVFQKYWINLKDTINKEFETYNKGEGQGKYKLWPEEGDYLIHEIHNACKRFNNSALPIQYGFLHWFFKYVLNGSMKEFEAELNNIPEEIKTLVDTKIVKQS